MGWKKLEDKCLFVFQLLTKCILSLLQPLSFLLLARISCAHYLYNLSPFPVLPPPFSFLFSFFYFLAPFLLYVLLSIIIVAAFVNGLREEPTASSAESDVFQPPPLYLGWVLMCISQLCVGLGIEGSILAGIDGSSFSFSDGETSLVSRVFLFLGLHETMLQWFRRVVKPVVNDTVFGGPRDERWIERIGIAVSFGGLWWWRMRDEVESLVVVAQVKKELSMPMEFGDFVAWCLYYITATLGMIRVVKGLMCHGIYLLSYCNSNSNCNCNSNEHESMGVEGNKV